MIDLSQIRMVAAMTDFQPALLKDDSAAMDRPTSLAVCNGIGERLRDIMRPGAGHLPPHLQQLLDRLQKTDDSPSIVPDLPPLTHTR